MGINKTSSAPLAQGEQDSPIIHQPQTNKGGNVNIPLISSHSSGLESLKSLDQLLIRQKRCGLCTLNREFIIQNSSGQNIFLAYEDNNCCGPKTLRTIVTDVSGNDLFKMRRRCRPCSFTCACYLDKIEVSDFSGNVIGTVVQEWCTDFIIKDQSGEAVLRIESGSMCFRNNIEFKIRTLNGREIGSILTKRTEIARGAFNEIDYFGITFPVDLDVRMKAVLIDAGFFFIAKFLKRR